MVWAWLKEFGFSGSIGSRNKGTPMSLERTRKVGRDRQARGKGTKFGHSFRLLGSIYLSTVPTCWTATPVPREQDCIIHIRTDEIQLNLNRISMELQRMLQETKNRLIEFFRSRTDSQTMTSSYDMSDCILHQCLGRRFKASDLHGWFSVSFHFQHAFAPLVFGSTGNTRISYRNR